jgi:hypothetical protein
MKDIILLHIKGKADTREKFTDEKLQDIMVLLFS